MFYIVLIPIIVTVLGYYLNKKEITLPEILINFGSVNLLVIGTFLIMKSCSTTDYEYNGYVVNEARYYEPYETYVEETCTRQVSTGTDSNGNTIYTTETYDCSYCKRVSERYVLVDTGGHEYEVSKATYEYFIKKFKDTPKFVDQNRHINYDGFCGKDGDMYRVKWDGTLETSVASTRKIKYNNVLQYKNSAFDYTDITEEEVKNIGLIDYPKIETYSQKTLLGPFENVGKLSYIQRDLNYFNGLYGPKYLARVFIILYRNKDISIATKQESYWQGGNRNEIVICIGVDDNNNIKWVKPFSWNKNKTLIPNLREEFFNLKKLDHNTKILPILHSNVSRYYNWRDFETDFSYLKFHVSKKQLTWLVVMSIILSLVGTIIIANNGYRNRN